MTSEFIDSLTNAESIRLFGVEKIRSKLFVELIKDFEGQQRIVQRSLALLNIGQGVIFQSGLYLCQLLAVKKILNKTASVADLILIANLLNQLAMPLNFTGVIYQEARNALQDLKALDDLVKGQLFTEPKEDLPCDDQTRLLLASANKIIFDNVTYHYKARHDSDKLSGVSNISLSIDEGEFSAVVGPSGGGKSTLIKLLFRLMSPDSGRILIGGQDINTIPLRDWRRYMGIVPQDTPLFNDTILNNITMGEDGISKKKVYEALSAAKLDDFISRLPNGIDTVVGERGASLSGGERQRLALSRCLSRDANILVFDEATSNLDVQTEKDIMRCVDKMDNLTRLIIAHRLSSIKNADKIIIMDHGNVREIGDHVSLLSDPTTMYSSLWTTQSKELSSTTTNTDI